ncbi:unnamed protein product [Symbiodinium sp. CCMP2592]|nr:unnamed protein product [Symbiodinium sp. CCMP2592]
MAAAEGGKGEQPFDNADVPSWVPGLPGIDPGTIHFTYAKDSLEILLLILLGVIYKRRVTDKRRQLPAPGPRRDFQTPAFSCCDHLGTFLYSFILQQVRMGDTYELAGVVWFWAPTLVFIASRIIANLMGLVPGMIAGLPTTSMFFFQGLFYFRWRRELRRKIAEDAEEDQCFSDFLLYSCCAPCLATQEAVEVDSLTGEAVGCFNLEILSVFCDIDMGQDVA